MSASKVNNISDKIGLKIKLLRMKQNLSQEELGAKASVSATSIGSIERGQSSPTIETLDKIAAALNIELKELVDVSKIDL